MRNLAVVVAIVTISNTTLANYKYTIINTDRHSYFALCLFVQMIIPTRDLNKATHKGTPTPSWQQQISHRQQWLNVYDY